MAEWERGVASKKALCCVNKHYLFIYLFIYRSRKIDKSNSSSSKNEIPHELNGDGTTILTDGE